MNGSETIYRTQGLGDLIPIDPMDTSVIDIGDLEHRVHPGVSGSPFTEDHLPEPPVIHFLLGHLLWDLHDHEIPRFNPEEWGGFPVGDWEVSQLFHGQHS